MGLNERAAKLAGYLKLNDREGERRIVVKTDDAPEWVTDVVRAVHGDLFPDDWTYETIKDAAEAIAEDGEDAELEAEIYNAQLLEWLRDYPNATSYCDDAIEQFGVDFRDGIISVIQYGQSLAQAEIVAAVIAELENLDLDDDESEGEE